MERSKVNLAMVFDLGSKKCFFEEMTQEQIERQISTNLYGPMSVTRAVLPIMRKARSSNRICNTSF